MHLKEWKREKEVFQKTDKKLKDFLQLDIEYVKNSINLRIHRKLRISGIGYLLFGGISAIASLISIFLII